MRIELRVKIRIIVVLSRESCARTRVRTLGVGLWLVRASVAYLFVVGVAGAGIAHRLASGLGRHQLVALRPHVALASPRSEGGGMYVDGAAYVRERASLTTEGT